MSKDDVFNTLRRLWAVEEVRLQEQAQNALDTLWRTGGTDHNLMLNYIESCAKLNYFKSYMLDVLNWVRHFKD